MKRRKVLHLPGMLCACFMLCLLPLLYRNAFFDINRFKVEAVRIVVPVIGMVSAAAWLLVSRNRKIHTTIRNTDICVLLFALTCFISSARTGFDSASLIGNEGRYCGLWVMLSCALAYWLISRNKIGLRLIGMLTVISAALVALIGVLNAIGFDPLSFYPRLSHDQRAAFISTIGNINFFGVYVAMMLPLALSHWINAENTPEKALGLAAAALMVLGVHASRTDSAFLGMQMAFLAMFALCGNSFKKMMRILAFWAYSWVTIPLMGMLMNRGPEQFAYTGLLSMLCTTHMAEIVALILAGIALAVRFFSNKGMRPIGRNRLCVVCSVLLLLAIMLIILAIFLFTAVYDDVSLGAAADILRFDDNWGSSRGFVYKRSLRAFRDADWGDKAFGQGVDLAKRILKPYDDNPHINVVGVFNDAHCQPLQLLITCGIFGAFSFCGLLFFVFLDSARILEKSPEQLGILCSICGYLPMMCLTVTQPILMTTLFALCGYAQAQYRMSEEGNP